MAPPARKKFTFRMGNHVMVTGSPGSGKTAWVYSFMARLPRNADLLAVAINTMGIKGFEHPKVTDVVIDTPPVIEFRSDDDREKDFVAKSVELEAIAAMRDDVDSEGRVVKRAPRVVTWTQHAVSVMDLLDADTRLRDRIYDYYRALYDCIARLAFRRKNVIIIVDELPMFITNDYISNWATITLQQGRNSNISTVSCTQRFQDVHKLCTDHATHWVLFSLSKRLREVLGKKVPHIRAVEHLDPYHWIWVDSEDEDHPYIMPPVPLVYNDQDNLTQRKVI